MGPAVGLRVPWFSYLCYARLVAVTVVYCLLIGIPGIMAMPFVTSAARGRIWRNLIRLYGRLAISVSGYPRVRVKYYDLAPGEKEPGVVVANHRSGSDAFMFAMWPADLVQIAGEWPFRLPFFGFFARCGGYYNIRKIQFDDFISRASVDILNNKISVVGFPEGTRSAGREMGQFHGTMFRLALKVKCPVYPFLILGTETVVNRQFVIAPGTIRLYKLPAMKPEQFEGWTSFRLKNYVRELMAAKIAELERAETNETVQL